MGERKVLNKYYPPDYDPAKIPRMRLSKYRQYKVRLMAPFNMRCKTCGHYIYKSTKFLAIKETVRNETYLGLYIFRFYIKCPTCCAEITFKTDPKNSDYMCENGATRNYEAWRMADKLGTIDDELEDDDEEEKNNPMRALEERTKESRREMDILDALEDIRDLNARAAKVDTNDLVASVQSKKRKEEEAAAERLRKEEEKAAKEFARRRGRLRRLDDEPPEQQQQQPSATGTRAKRGAKREAASFAHRTGSVSPTPSASSATSSPLGDTQTKRAKVAWREKKIGTLGTSSLSGLVRRSRTASSSSSSSSSTASETTASANKRDRSGDHVKTKVGSGGSGGGGLVSYDTDDSDSSDAD